MVDPTYHDPTTVRQRISNANKEDTEKHKDDLYDKMQLERAAILERK
jgi:hypothetical protein